MARKVKVTFTLDEDTVRRIERTASRLGIPRSGVVREAVAEYAAGADHLGAAERARMLKLFDSTVAKIPTRPAKEVDAELKAIRAARRAGGRGSTGGSRR